MTAVLLTALFLAQQAPPPEKCALSGTVVDSLTGLPLSKVSVIAEHAGGGQAADASTITDAKGTFIMVDVAPGQYRLASRRNGYLDTYYGAKRPSGSGSTLALISGQKLEDLKIKVMPFGVIAGVVSDSDGEPLTGAFVWVYRSVNARGETGMQTYEQTRTDDLGQYRVADLPPGKYYVSARWNPFGRAATDHSVASSEPPEFPVTTFYPGTADPATAQAVELGVGSRRTGTDVSIVRTRVYKIAVHVDAPHGLKASATPRYLVEGVTPDWGFDDANSNGDLEISGVPPGAYTMLVSVGEPDTAGDGDQTRLRIFCSTRVPVVVDHHDLEGLRVTASGCAVAEGHVTVEGTEKNELGGTTVDFEHGRRNATLRPDGSFATSLNPGPGQIDLSRYTTERGLYIKSIRSGNLDVLRNGFNAGPSEHVDLEIVLGSDGGRVEGIVSDADDKAAIGATVVLIPTDPALRARFDFTKDAVTDQSGHFELRNAAPGEYKLFAWDDIEKDSWFDPDVMKDYETKGEPVSVKVKDTQIVKLHVIP